MPSSTLAELAHLSNARLEGDPDCLISAVNTLESAGMGDITFLANRSYVSFLPDTNASAVILTDADLSNCKTNALVCDEPYLAYAKVANCLYPPRKNTPDIADSAVIGQDCQIGHGVTIAAHVTIGSHVQIADYCVLGPGCVLQDDVTIGQHCFFAANVTLCHGVTLGKHVILSPGVVIGADGFGLARDKKQWLKIPQVGSVEIMDNVEIGANSTVDRGAIKNTVIGRGVKIDNQVQIGHNVIIGADTAIAGCSAIAGSTTIGERCMIGGAVCVAGHIRITDDVIITGMSGVANSIHQTGVYSSGMPITKNNIWRRNMIRLKQLDALLKKILHQLNH